MAILILMKSQYKQEIYLEEDDQGELQSASDDLYYNSLVLGRKKKELREQVNKLIKENSKILNDNDKLKE